MPKPVLSDSLFNANDVATKVLENAELQITNSELGVSDKSAHFVPESDVTFYDVQAFAFNGFMFISFELKHNSSTPSSGELLGTISNPYRPTSNTRFPITGHEGDSASNIAFATDGSISANNPFGSGSNANWYVVLNGFYRYA